MNYLPVLVLSALSLTACMHQEAKPIAFYRLTADANLSRSLSGVEANSEVSGFGYAQPTSNPIPQGMIGLGPIHIPDYLKRPQMLVGVGANEFKLSEHHRWAEDLDDNIALALFKTLPVLLGTNQIVRHPWPQRQAIAYQIGIDIVEFHVDAQGQSRLIAQWFIKHKDHSIDKRSVYYAPASTSDYGLMVKAQSLCLSQLAQEIAASLRQSP